MLLQLPLLLPPLLVPRIFRGLSLAAFVKHDTEAERSDRIACLSRIPKNRLGLLLIAALT
jgi:hypothetical protein